MDSNAIVGFVEVVESTNIPLGNGWVPRTTVRFKDIDQSAWLDPSRADTALLGDLLEDVAGLPLQTFVDRDPVSGAVTRALPVRVLSVRMVSAPENEDVAVLFQPSHAYHYLRRGNPEFKELLGELQSAREQRRFVLVAETDAHEIVAVRQTRERPFELIGATVTLKDLETAGTLSSDGFRLALTELTEAASEQLSDAMRARGHIGGLGKDWIPFAYPEDGCTARAHRMCELMQVEHSVVAGKIWLFATSPPIFVPTVNTNNGSCNVPWDYHVAPIVRVKVSGSATLMVIDPSLGFLKPVTIGVWTDMVNGLSNEATTRRFSDASVYDQALGGFPQSDLGFSNTPKDLLTFQRDLTSRIRLMKKPPPYCP